MVATAHKPVLIVIAGPNSSGKTTITTQILQHEWMEDAVYINPDQIAKDKYGDFDSHFAKIVRFFRYIVGWFFRIALIAQRLFLEFHQFLAAQLL